MTTIFLYSKLGTCSRRAIVKTRKSYGQPYNYSPRGDLLERLSKETGMTVEEAYNQLLKEREIILKLRGIS